MQYKLISGNNIKNSQHDVRMTDKLIITLKRNTSIIMPYIYFKGKDQKI